MCGDGILSGVRVWRWHVALSLDLRGLECGFGEDVVMTVLVRYAQGRGGLARVAVAVGLWLPFCLRVQALMMPFSLTLGLMKRW